MISKVHKKKKKKIHTHKKVLLGYKNFSLRGTATCVVLPCHTTIKTESMSCCKAKKDNDFHVMQENKQ